MLPKIADAAVIAGHRLRITFTDGQGGDHDFLPMMEETGSLILPLRDEAYFARLFVEAGALTWPNGFDIAAGWLLREMRAADELRPTVAID